MRFHLTMMCVVIAISMAMHTMANAATALFGASAAQTQRFDQAVQRAGETLNEQLLACRDQ